MATVVVGFVPKPEGEAALVAAIEQVQQRSGRLVVASARRQEADEEWVAKTQAELAAARERLETLGIEHAIHEAVTDFDIDAADDLVQVARDQQADLLVIGVRRRSPTGKLILGSQAQRILLEAPCPVLVVKPE